MAVVAAGIFMWHERTDELSAARLYPDTATTAAVSNGLQEHVGVLQGKRNLRGREELVGQRQMYSYRLRKTDAPSLRLRRVRACVARCGGGMVG